MRPLVFFKFDFDWEIVVLASNCFGFDREKSWQNKIGYIWQVFVVQMLGIAGTEAVIESNLTDSVRFWAYASLVLRVNKVWHPLQN